MMLNDENKKSLKTMLKGRAFYLALSVCVLAAGIVSYQAMGKRTVDKILSEVTTAQPDTHIHISERVVTDPAPENKPEPVREIATEPHFEQTPETQAVFENDAPTVNAQESEPQEIRFGLPLTARVGKDYSMGVPVFSDTMGDWRTHNGIDFEGDEGQAVKTIAPGKVISVTSDPLYGNTVKIDHGSGIVSSVCGLSDSGLIAEGTQVDADTVIGVVGVIPVEKNDPAHIHLEIRQEGRIVDPLEIMGFVGAED